MDTKFTRAFAALWVTIDNTTTPKQMKGIQDVILNAKNPRLWIVNQTDTTELIDRLKSNDLLSAVYEFNRQAIMAFNLEGITWGELRSSVTEGIVCTGFEKELDITDKDVSDMFSKYTWLPLLYVLHYGNTLGLVERYRRIKENQ